MRTTILTGLLLVAATTFAEDYGSLFLTVYPGARHSAMAGVGAAVAGTADGVFYNPAGPAFLKSPEAGIEVSHVPWMFPTDYWSAAGIVPLLPALNIGVFTSGAQEVVADEFSWSEWEAGVTASARVSDWLGFGLNLESQRMHYVTRYWDFEHESTFTFVTNGSAVATDAGVLARPHTRMGRPSIGVAVRNVGTRIRYRSGNHATTAPLPALLDAGIGWTVTARELGIDDFPLSLPESFFPREWLMDNWCASAFYDFRKVFLDEFPSHAVGVEVRPLPFVAARVGWFNSKNGNASDTGGGMTWGLGLDLRYVRFDFCEDRELFYLNQRKNYRFSFALNLGEPLLREGGLLRG